MTTKPPPGPPVTVTYTVDHSWDDWGGTRFVGHFTLVNHTGSRVRGWTLQARLPGDQVRWVSTSSDGSPSYPDWSQDRGGLIITGPRSGEAIPAHSSVVLYLSAYGSTASPATCTINGMSC